jgi:filamentous hemagglutinin family protein
MNRTLARILQNLNPLFRLRQSPRSPTALLTFAALFGSTTILHAHTPAPLPTDPTVVHGSAAFNTIGDHMTVTSSPGTILDWQSFSIGANHGVYFQQPDAASQVLNRVIGDDPSQILGSLGSNGAVWLINSHGVLFGQNARVDVAGLVTSTLDISNIDFLAGKYSFVAAGGHAGQVANQGDLRTSFGGRVWLLGDQVRNEGVIQTPGGHIVLAAGKSLELVDSGAPNVIVRVTAPENEVANLGSLVSTLGGSVDLHASIVNQQGIVRADSIGTDEAGRVVLKASQGLNITENSVTRAEGGSVSMSAGTTTYLAGLVDVSKAAGTSGSIQLNTGRLEGTTTGGLLADGEQGGHIRVEGDGMVGFSSRLSATGSVQGGTVDVTGANVYLLNADIDSSGGSHGGAIHLGGGWQGGGSLPHAREVLVGVGSEIKANGGTSGNISGKGGEIAVWSTQSSQHYGLLQALNGGRIELSSQGEVRQTGALQAGLGGMVLFDPKNIIITDNPPDSITVAQRLLGSDPRVKAQPGDEFGAAISLDGDRLAVGAPHSMDTSAPGGVYLFTGAGAGSSGLALQATLGTANLLGVTGLLPGDRFGAAVALRGDLLVVGAPYTNENTGAVYIFDGVTAGGQPHQRPTKIDSATEGVDLVRGDGFGFALALSEGRLVVGANGVANKGAVYLFSGENEFQTFFPQGVLLSPSTTNNGFFGRAVALEGDRLVVGAPGENDNRGTVYLYAANFSDFGQSVLRQPPLSLSAAATNTFFGISVSLDGEHMAIGASGENFGAGDDNRAAAGSVYIYSGVGPDLNLPNLPQKLDASVVSGLQANDRFGDSVSLFGDQLAVGGRGREGNTGAAYLFTGISSLGGSTVDSANFSDPFSGDSYITPAAITALLNAGTAVVLQANNDVTVSSPITVSSDNEGGRGGNFTLQAGRNIAINASVITDNGNFTGVAGHPDANASFKDPGTPTITIGSIRGEGSLNVGSGTATLAAIDGNFVNNAGNQAILTSGAGRWLIYSTVPANSVEGFSGYNKHYNEAFTSNGTPAYASTGNWFFYSFAPVLSVRLNPSQITYGDPAPSGFTLSGTLIDNDADPGIGSSIAGWTFDGSRSSSGNLAAGLHNATYTGGLSSSLGYQFVNDPANTLNIDKATLTYVANPVQAVAGGPIGGLTGFVDILGLKGGDTLQGETSGTLSWTTGAGANSLPGIYAVTGGGLTSANYNLVQAPGNATALQLFDGHSPNLNPPAKQDTVDTAVQSINVAMLGAFPILDWSTIGYLVDMTSKAPNFGSLNLSRMNWVDMQQLIDMRREFKEKLFADAIYKLEQDPSLANVQPCPSLADIDTGLCRITDAQRLELASKAAAEELHKGPRRAKIARLPQIERKFVVLFGIDKYADKTIPPLENAVFDAETLAKLFADKLGYEARVVRNATKADIVRTLNQLAAEMKPHDSVIIYYAGHGYRNDKTIGGYWIPSDASVSDPATWISNTDVSRMLAEIGANQIVMIADSCYSGNFAEQKFRAQGPLGADELLARRTVVMMSSGGDEPVADEGRGGHSIFAWDLMQALRNVDNWRPGTNIFQEVRREVMRSFPQTPQYGAIKSAGHESGGDYLFEFRELE